MVKVDVKSQNDKYLEIGVHMFYPFNILHLNLNRYRH
jgi:hypothetical protein